MYSATIVRARELFGYATRKERLFARFALLKLSASELNAAAAALRADGLRPLGAHLSGIMQALIELNVGGCGVLYASQALFRGPLPPAKALMSPSPVGLGSVGGSAGASAGGSASGSQRWYAAAADHAHWHEGSVPSEWLWDTVAGRQAPERRVACELEVDVRVQDVLNPREVEQLPLSQAGDDKLFSKSLDFVWEAERERCLAAGEDPPVFSAARKGADERRPPETFFDGEQALRTMLREAAGVAKCAEVATSPLDVRVMRASALPSGALGDHLLRRRWTESDRVELTQALSAEELRSTPVRSPSAAAADVATLLSLDPEDEELVRVLEDFWEGGTQQVQGGNAERAEQLERLRAHIATPVPTDNKNEEGRSDDGSESGSESSDGEDEEKVDILHVLTQLDPEELDDEIDLNAVLPEEAVPEEAVPVETAPNTALKAAKPGAPPEATPEASPHTTPPLETRAGDGDLVLSQGAVDEQAEPGSWDFVTMLMGELGDSPPSQRRRQSSAASAPCASPGELMATQEMTTPELPTAVQSVAAANEEPRLFKPLHPPPSEADCDADLVQQGLPRCKPHVIMSDPTDKRFIKTTQDIGARARIVPTDPARLPPFHPPSLFGSAPAPVGPAASGLRLFTPLLPPPSEAEVNAWAAQEVSRRAARRNGRESHAAARPTPAAAPRPGSPEYDEMPVAQQSQKSGESGALLLDGTLELVAAVATPSSASAAPSVPYGSLERLDRQRDGYSMGGKPRVSLGSQARHVAQQRVSQDSAGLSQMAVAPSSGAGASHLTAIAVEVAAALDDMVYACCLVVRRNAAVQEEPYERALIVDASRCPAFADRAVRGLNMDEGDVFNAGFLGAPGFEWDAGARAHVLCVDSESGLIDAFAQTVRWVDPDIICGYDTQRASLGALLARADELRGHARNGGVAPKGKLLANELSRLPEERRADTDAWSMDHGSGVVVTGRVVINAWRVMRNDLKLTHYGAQTAAEGVLKRRVPSFGRGVLARMLAQHQPHVALVGASRLLSQTELTLELLERIDLFGRNAEFARVFGIPFQDVMLRGSQFRVESLLARLVRTQNCLLTSPSKEEVAGQPPLNHMALTMEPEGKYYSDPVVVLDFTSLYPSLVIAYNLCYSTCLGKVRPTDEAWRGLGPQADWEPPPGALAAHASAATISPSGTAFVPRSERQGVLPRMLTELLATRKMVKKAMKSDAARRSPALRRALDARQLGLKLIANVTYGYTSASFSGRMPCAELADSIVSYGRRTLERTIETIEGNAKWDAEVVYGDTDSVFVLLRGRDRFGAYAVAQEMIAAVTADNPAPVELKFEKVYQPCMLASKKRYVGYMYETADPDETPKFDAKGIETVRRDGCAAGRVVVQGALQALFAANDVSAAIRYVRRQVAAVLSGECPLEQLMFSREVKLGRYVNASMVPPAVVALKAMREDKHAEPPRGWRVRYVFCRGAPKDRLVDRCFDPREVALSPALRPAGNYYVDKVILPALNRLIGAGLGLDVFAWVADMSRTEPAIAPGAQLALQTTRKHRGQQLTIDTMLKSCRCVVCGAIDKPSSSGATVCAACRGAPQAVAWSVMERLRRLERAARNQARLCASACSGVDGAARFACEAVDCAIYCVRARLAHSLLAAAEVARVLRLVDRPTARATAAVGAIVPYHDQLDEEAKAKAKAKAAAGGNGRLGRAG